MTELKRCKANQIDSLQKVVVFPVYDPRFRTDLSIMAEIRQLVTQFKAKYQNLHVLVNNAGGAFGKRQVISEGFEKTFALNYLNYFLLTNLLLDTLRASAPARIVKVSSDSHKGAHLDFDDLQSQKGNFIFNAYGRSKLADVVFSYELAQGLSGTGVTANVLHPGLVHTGFANNLGAVPAAFFGFIMRFVGLTPEQGAQTSVYLASSSEVANVTGKYFEKSKAVPSGPAAYDETPWARLWEVSDKMVAAPGELSKSLLKTRQFNFIDSLIFRAILCVSAFV